MLVFFYGCVFEWVAGRQLLEPSESFVSHLPLVDWYPLGSLTQASSSCLEKLVGFRRVWPGEVVMVWILSS